MDPRGRTIRDAEIRPLSPRLGAEEAETDTRYSGELFISRNYLFKHFSLISCIS